MPNETQKREPAFRKKRKFPEKRRYGTVGAGFLREFDGDHINWNPVFMRGILDWRFRHNGLAHAGRDSMRPIAILQHESTQGPGVLLDHLEQNNLPYRLIFPAADGTAPVDARKFSGLVVLGSDHSANESLPWIKDELALLQDAVRRDVPVLGHCFGAQILARAMGASVSRNSCPNIGWSPIWITPPAQHRMGLPRQVTIFNWHYDTFEIPAGAIRTMYGSHCLNKGFLRGRHWAFQGHLEVTEKSVRNWCAAGRAELRRAHGPAAQNEAQILEGLHDRIAALHLIADQTYQAWSRQLDRPIAIAMRRASS